MGFIFSRHAQLNKYEAGQNTPPLDRLILLAEVLDTSVDHLLTGNPGGNILICNTRLIQRIQVIEGCAPKEKETIIELLDAMTAKHNIQNTAKTMGA